MPRPAAVPTPSARQRVMRVYTPSRRCRGPSKYQCRARVWPAGGSSAPFAVPAPVVDYDWGLSLQEGGDDDGCWMVDSVMPDASPRDAWDDAMRGDGSE